MDSPAANPHDARLELLAAWTRETLGTGTIAIAPASADASFRRYFRVTHDGETCIAMDAPPDREDVEPYLRVAGHLVFAYFFARMAQAAQRAIDAGSTDPFYTAKLQTARFYFAKLFPETATLMRLARSGSKVLMDTDLALA